MKYPYHVIHDGVMYAPGEEVPVEEQTTITEAEEVPAEDEQPRRRRK